MKHIIDTVSKLKKECDVMCGDSPHDVRTYNEAIDDALQAIRALIASSPQVDGMVLVPSEPTEEMIEAGDKVAVIHYEYGENLYIENTDEVYKAMLSAYKPQADDVRKDAWISVEDRLPPMGEVVLVYGVTIGQAFDEWVTYHECPVSFSTITVETGEGWSEHEFEEVTHWQPLPAPPLDKARE